MQPGTGLAILGSALGSAKLVERLLGPTADYLGVGIRDWTQRRIENTGRIFKIACHRLGDGIDEPGSIPPRVLFDVINEGSTCDDPLAAEYFGGLLASSRCGSEGDDRAHYYLKLVSGLSTYQLRSHYVFYAALRRAFCGRQYELGRAHDCQKIGLFIAIDAYARAMDQAADRRTWRIVTHAMHGLGREQLIDPVQMAWGQPSFLRRMFGGNDSRITTEGLIFQPSGLGVELFLWVHGLPDIDTNNFLAERIDITEVASIAIPSDSQALTFAGGSLE